MAKAKSKTKETIRKRNGNDARTDLRAPNKWKPEFAVQVEKLAKLGATKQEISDFFGVNRRTISNWGEKHPAFLKAFNNGAALADAEVASKLFTRAVGYETVEKHFEANADGDMVEKRRVHKQVASDTVACIFWLKNRRPDLWRDRVEATGAGGEPLIPEQNVEDLERARLIAFALVKAERQRHKSDDAETRH